jgi:hypothetical protein
VELEKKARIYFLDNVGIEEASSNNILGILQTVKYDVEEMKRDAAIVPPSDGKEWFYDCVFNVILGLYCSFFAFQHRWEMDGSDWRPI